MGAVYLTELANVLRAAGRTVIEVDHMAGGKIVEGPAWKTRSRGSGGFDPGRPWAICWHHTASNPGTSAESNVAYATFNSDNEPVCNLYIHNDGVWYVCAAGATNTEGKGGPLAVSRGTIPVDQANTYCVGIEAGNSGVGEPWPQVMIDSYFAGTDALADYLELDLSRDVITHHQWASDRKIDPATAAAVQGPWRPHSITTSGTWSDDDIRTENVRRATPAPTPPPGDDDMTRLGPYLIQATGKDGTLKDAVYATDGQMMMLRWLATTEALAGYRWTVTDQLTKLGLPAPPELAPDGPILAIDTIAAYGVVIG